MGIIEVKQPKIMIRFNHSADPVSTIWTEQISEEQKRFLKEFNLEAQINDLIEKVLLAYTDATRMRF